MKEGFSKQSSRPEIFCKITRLVPVLNKTLSFSRRLIRADKVIFTK